jgi:serine/threonine protein kinase
VLGEAPEHAADCFRQLARRVHPDHFQNDPAALGVATAALRQLTEWKQEADRKIAAGTYGDKKRHDPPRPIIIKLPRDTLALGHLIRSGDITDVYSGSLGSGPAVVVKIARDARDNDLLERERSVLQQLDKLDPKAQRYFPARPVATVSIKGRSATVLPRYHSHVAFDRICERSKLDLRDLAWMLRRSLEGLGHLHRAGIAHGAVLPPHLLYHPVDHGLRLIDWCCSVPLGERARLLRSDPRPTEDMAMLEWDLTEKQAMAFFYGFDSDDKLGSHSSAYARLGRLYRSRFGPAGAS